MKKRWLLRAAGILAVLWLCFVGYIYRAMSSPIPEFTATMKRLPMPAMMLFPFETLWNRARAGTLTIGDAAPDFTLASVDGKTHVRLSEHRGVRPVVLIFGSYT